MMITMILIIYINLYDEDDNDDPIPTCNINDSAGLVDALCIGRRARNLFSCVTPVMTHHSKLEKLALAFQKSDNYEIIR